MPEAVGGPLQEAIEVMDTLRSEGGCPWDREQTHASLAPYAVEEAHEVAEAAETGDRDELVEELGDLLLQVLFHARVGAEGTLGAPFDLDDVAATLVAKLRRRHPHVFADSQARTSAEVTAGWHVIKAQEKQRSSVLDGIPAALPALARTQKMLSRAQRAGIELSGEASAEPGSTGQSGTERVGQSGAGQASADSAEQAGADPAERIGAELIDVVRRAQAAGVDAEAALRGSARALDRRIRSAEQNSAGHPVPPASA